MPLDVDLGESYVGGEARFYYNSATHDSPDWEEIKNRSDLNTPDSRTLVAAPNAATWPFIGSLAGGRTVGLAWTADQKRGVKDVALDYCLSKYDSNDDVEFAVADGDINVAGTKYRRLIAVIHKAEDSKPIDGVTTWSFEAAFSANAGYLPTRATAS